MAQWILEDPEHVNVRGAQEALYDNTGRKISTGARHVFAKFQRGGLPDYAVDVARTTYGFRKMPDGVEIQDFAGFYDSEVDQLLRGWTDEERAEIELKLNGFAIPVGKPAAVAPWPKYDSTGTARGVSWANVAEKNIALADDFGVSVDAVLSYELATRNQPELVAAYRAHLEVEPVLEEALPPLIEA